METGAVALAMPLTHACDPGHILSPPVSFRAWLPVTAFAQPGSHVVANVGIASEVTMGSSSAAFWGTFAWHGAETLFWSQHLPISRSVHINISISGVFGKLGRQPALGQDFLWPRREAGHVCPLSRVLSSARPRSSRARTRPHAHSAVFVTAESVLCACVSGKQVIDPRGHVFQRHVSLVSVTRQAPVGRGWCPRHIKVIPVEAPGLPTGWQLPLGLRSLQPEVDRGWRQSRKPAPATEDAVGGQGLWFGNEPPGRGRVSGLLLCV